jgi:LPS O-antigen subunit length determinant protein (WzzB/FepE family)
MKKNHSLHSNTEIDLRILFQTLWNKKIEIALIALISFVIIVSYNNYKPKKPDLFNNTLVIKPAKENEFLNFVSIHNYINKRNSKKNLNFKEFKNTKVLDRFIEEFLDYQELITILKENDNIKKKISQLSKYDQQQKLYGYAKSFNIEKLKVESANYVLKFTWPADDREIRDIINESFKLVEKNLRESIFRELESYYELEKNLITNRDLERIEYLLEQSKIAKEQGIKVQSVVTEEENMDIPLDVENKNSLDGITLNINSNNNSYTSYYLKGYKTIDMEIELIRNRKYVLLENIREEINLLKRKDIKWVDYNIFLLDTKLQSKNETFSLSFSILFSLIIGLVYAFISNAIQSLHKNPLKKR